MMANFVVQCGSFSFQTWTDTAPPGVGVAPPFRPTISLRAIVGLNGGLGLRGFLQTKIYTTCPLKV